MNFSTPKKEIKVATIVPEYVFWIPQKSADSANWKGHLFW
jgi:hypothetical protein